MRNNDENINFDWKKFLIGVGVIGVVSAVSYAAINVDADTLKKYFTGYVETDGNNVELNESVAKVEEKVEVVNFDKFSNEEITKLVMDANKDIKSMRATRLFAKEAGNGEILCAMPPNYSDPQKRKAVIDSYFIDGTVKETYGEIDGETYLKEEKAVDLGYIYDFYEILSREQKENTLRVKFRIEKVEGFKGVNKDTKTLEFRVDKDGKLKLSSKIKEDSFINMAENINDDNTEEFVKKERELYSIIVDKLSTVLRADQKVGSIFGIYKDPKSGDKYYGITIEEPTQNAVCYFINERTKAIYGHYQKKFVA